MPRRRIRSITIENKIPSSSQASIDSRSTYRASQTSQASQPQRKAVHQTKDGRISKVYGTSVQNGGRSPKKSIDKRSKQKCLAGQLDVGLLDGYRNYSDNEENYDNELSDFDNSDGGHTPMEEYDKDIEYENTDDGNSRHLLVKS